MPSACIVRSSPIVKTARAAQLAGLFDIPPTERSEQVWDINLPLDERPWSIGLIIGPSGSGKSTVARELFGGHVAGAFSWPVEKSLVDGFPDAMSIKDITALLSSVGFSSPPAWLRPFHVLSTGEQFRVTMARILAETTDLAVVDEFTSVVDRTVAQIGSAAIAKTVRRLGTQFIAVTCHYDVEDWLQPDWVFQPHLCRFQWRELQRRPPIELCVSRCGPEAWALFRQHHYLNTELNRYARCFLTAWQHVPVGFTAVLPMMGVKGQWREHRTVCLPDFQGVGIGMRQSELVAAVVCAATQGQYRSTTSHPGFIAGRARSTEWRMARQPNFTAAQRRGTDTRARRLPRQRAMHRLTATFRYVGKSWPDVATARALWAESFSLNRITHTSVSAVASG